MRGVILLVLAMTTLAARPAAADGPIEHALAGPVFGVTWGKGKPLSGTVGVEAGVELNLLLHGNVGMTWRDQELFSYVELDGWYIVGATLGAGYGGKSEWQPVIGIWEAWPLALDENSCDEATVIAMSAGYRWTGMHELYLAGKYGEVESFCFE